MIQCINCVHHAHCELDPQMVYLPDDQENLHPFYDCDLYMEEADEDEMEWLEMLFEE